MTFDLLYIAIMVIGIPIYLVISLGRQDWIVVLLFFGGGLGILVLCALWAWAIGDLKYLPRWLLFEDVGRMGYRIILVFYGFVVASILLALRRLIGR